MAMVMCLMAGCGSATETADPTEAPAETEAEADTTADTASEGGSFYIGGIGPITGDNAIYGMAVMNGAPRSPLTRSTPPAVSTATPSSTSLRTTWPTARPLSTLTTT